MTARIVVTVVLVVVISMALQIPEALLSAYMVFFVTKENKVVTTLMGVFTVLGVTIAFAMSLLVYRYTFDNPGLRVPAMAFAPPRTLMRGAAVPLSKIEGYSRLCQGTNILRRRGGGRMFSEL